MSVHTAIGPPTLPAGGDGRILLPCLLLFGAMFNLTLVVAGLKEFVIGELGGTVTDASLFFSVETFSYILFAPLWGILSDRTGRRRPFVVTGFLLSALVYASYVMVRSVPTLLVLRFFQGAFAVMGWSLVMASVVDQPGGQRGRNMGLMGAALIFGVALGAPIGGYLTRWHGPRAPLLAAAALFALLALAAIGLTEPQQRSRGPRVAEILTALSSRPRLLLPLVFHFVDRLAVGLFVVIFPLYVDSLGAGDPAVRGRYLALFLLPFALLQYFTGKLVERTGPYPPLLLGSLLYGVLLCAVGYSQLFMLWWVMIGLGLFAAVMFPPAILLTSQLSDPATRGSAMGGFNLAGSFGFALGPLLGGAAYAAWGFGTAFALCGLIEIALAIVGWLVVRRGRS
jgi:DHA1 family tetracycline resistance protein-like MFS transporter